MTSTTDFDLALLYQAQATPIGIVIHCPNPDTARQRLYRARKEDPALANLQFRLVTDRPEELWIVRENVQVGAGAAPGQFKPQA